MVLHSCDEATITLPDVVERLELQGATLLGKSTWGYTRLGLSAPARRLPKALELFASVVREPAFDEPDLAHHVETQIAAWRTRMASPTAVTRETLHTSLFGSEQREGRPLAGSPETLGAITREAAREWHERTWVPDGSTLILAGDLKGLDPEELVAPLETWQAPAPLRRLLKESPAAPESCWSISRMRPRPWSRHSSQPLVAGTLPGHPSNWAGTSCAGHSPVA